MHQVAPADPAAGRHRPEAAIDARGLVKSFGNGVRALDGVDLEARYGEVLALLGRNGSGKTTAVRVLTTLTRPTAGTASVAGRDVRTDPAGVRAAVGVTMQAAALDPDMTGREHLELVAGLLGRGRREARAVAADLLAEHDLTRSADRLIGTWSGGMRRRLDLASALMQRPRVLFLDEPTTGLDAPARRLLWSRVHQIRAAGTAVLLTTQYLEEAEVLADRIAILDAGRVIARGTADELKRRYGRTTLRIRTAGDGGDGTGWEIIPVGSAEEALDRLCGRRHAGGRIEAFRLDHPSLEDAFLELTGTPADPATGTDR